MKVGLSTLQLAFAGRARAIRKIVLRVKLPETRGKRISRCVCSGGKQFTRGGLVNNPWSAKFEVLHTRGRIFTRACYVLSSGLWRAQFRCCGLAGPHFRLRNYLILRLGIPCLGLAGQR